MSKYINAAELKLILNREHLNYSQMIEKKFVLNAIDEMPDADVRENIHGEWQITNAYPHNVYCSECHERFAQTHWAVWEDGSLPRNFCPNCGARMEEMKGGMMNDER